MYLLINIYESEGTSAYVNEVKQFNTEEDAETQMKKDVEQAFSDYHETWSAENEDEEQIDEQEGPTPVASHLVGEAPDVGHAHGRPHRCQDEAPSAGKALCVVFHNSSPFTKGAAGYRAAAVIFTGGRALLC